MLSFNLLLVRSDFTAMGLSAQTSDKDNNYYCNLGCNVQTFFQQVQCSVTGSSLDEGYAIGIDNQQSFECNFLCDDFGTCITIGSCFINPDSSSIRLYQQGQIGFYSFDVDTNCITIPNASTYIRQCTNVCSQLSSGKTTVCNSFTGDSFDSSVSCIDNVSSASCLSIVSSTDYLILPECSNGSITTYNANKTVKCQTNCNGLNCDSKCDVDDDKMDDNSTLYAFAITDMVLLGVSIFLSWLIMHRVYKINYKPINIV